MGPGEVVKLVGLSRAGVIVLRRPPAGCRVVRGRDGEGHVRRLAVVGHEGLESVLPGFEDTRARELLHEGRRTRYPARGVEDRDEPRGAPAGRRRERRVVQSMAGPKSSKDARNLLLDGSPRLHGKRRRSTLGRRK
jgi:hypothetical protein